MPGVGALDVQALPWMGALSPLCAISPARLRSPSSSRVFCESYPAPRWMVMPSGSGPISPSVSSVGANSGESCRFAGLALAALPAQFREVVRTAGPC